MAAESLVKELCEEASCSICLDFFKDPVMLTECGHSFCRACLARTWGASGAEASCCCCPQCRGRAQEGNLRPNQQLASVVEIAKKLALLEGKEAGVTGGEGKGPVCEKHREPLKFFCKEDGAPVCLVCGLSREHRDHEVLPLEEAFQASRAAARRGRACQKHQEPLKLFCQDDGALICVVCDRSKEHRDHATLPLEEASQDYKGQLRDCLEKLKEKRERIVACQAGVVKESRDLLKRAMGEKPEKFRQLRSFVEEQEKLLLAQAEEVEKEVARNRDQHLAKLSEELSSLDSLMQEMEEKCQQPACELLEGARSILRRYEEKEAFENPVAFPLALKRRLWNFFDFSPLWEGIQKLFKDLQKANVTLNPDTAHPLLVLSEDQKSVRVGEVAQDLPQNPERFNGCCAVVSCEEFTAGCHSWEVLVGSEESWVVGVARKSVRRSGYTMSPEEGIWAVGKWTGRYRVSQHPSYCPLSLTGELKRIRVCLNYSEGRVAFFNADQEALLYEFSGASFSGETLLPFFLVQQKGQLRLCS